MTTESPADPAYHTYVNLLREHALFRQDDRALSESDTRAKFIDPLFRDVLGWTETEIRREKPCTVGFADYTFGLDFSYLLVEAKRTKPRFFLNAPSRARHLRVDGPHLLGQKKLRTFLHQAQRYAVQLGAQTAVLTNGSQLILFQPYRPGKAWTGGTAIVWHDHNDIKDNFAEFFNLLARDRVAAGSLLEAFERDEALTLALHAPIEHVRDPDRDLIRNPYWTKLARVLSPLLTDQTGDAITQQEIITNCYVTTPISDETDRTLDQLIRDGVPPFLKNAGIVDLKRGARGKTAFEHNIQRDILSAHPGTYILTGGVGSGKTTFLHRFTTVVDPEFVQRYCLWFYLDFRTIGTVDPANAEHAVTEFTFRRVREQLKQQYAQHLPTSSEDVLKLFQGQVEDARLTRLFGLSEGSADWNREVGLLLERLFADDATFTRAVLEKLRHNSLRVVIALDNTDQLGEQFQQQVFLFAQRLTAELGAFCIVSLREEKFFAAYRRGIFDAYASQRFHLGSPDLRRVLERRLVYGQRKLKALADELAISAAELPDINELLRVFIKSTTQQNNNIVRMLSCVSNGDLRYALQLFGDFIGSGNTNVDKILQVVKKEGGYTVPFHEFAKSAILGSRRYYRSSVSQILNVFQRSEAPGASHCTSIRALARLSATATVQSPHGEGFVDTKTLLKEYRQSFGHADDFVLTTGELIRRGLIESEPPKVVGTEKADALRATAAGLYYWRYLIRAFAYIDLVFMDTAITDRTLAKRLGELGESFEMQDRFARARTFLDYIARTELDETQQAAKRAGPYQTPLLPDIQMQIEKEIQHIRKRSGD